ncbi:MAG: Bicarbonate transport system permease protein CmpB [Pelotomaculum sp. PtaB.Bin104]|nr:MAG: Bicarbonate transport system permease protein CmpB [Pelotomaculum sp. PtaB.Bin104]
MKNFSFLNKGLPPFLGLAFFLLVWQIGSGFYNQVVLPSPVEVAHTFWNLAAGGELLEHGRLSIIRGLTGFGLALILGLPLGLLIGLNGAAASLFRPLVVVLQVIPLVSWLLLALIWIGFSKVPVFVVFVTTIPLIIINTVHGVENVDGQLLQMASVFRIGRLRVIREIYLPQIAPYIMAGVSAAIGTTWKAVAMAELLSVHQGIGSGMALARMNLNTAALFAWTIFLVFLGLLTDRLLAYLMRWKLRRWGY